MRRYQLRQKLWTFGDDFAICDEAGREVYYVDGRRAFRELFKVFGQIKREGRRPWRLNHLALGVSAILALGY